MDRIQRKVSPKFNRNEYTLVGEVVVVNDKSILVKRVSTNTFFWIDNGGFKCDLNKGDMGSFTMNINTFPSSQGEPKGLIKTKLRLAAPAIKSLPITDGNEFLGGSLMVDIDEVVTTEIPGLFLIKMRAKGNGEVIYARHYDIKAIPQVSSNKAVKVRLMKSKTTITKSGEVFEDQKVRDEDIGVGIVTNTYPT